MPSISVDTSTALTYIYHQCLRQNWAFASFRLPGHYEPSTYIQQKPDSAVFQGFPEKNGFVFAPFDPTGKHKRIGVIPDLIIKGWQHEDVNNLFPYSLNGYKLKLKSYVYPGIHKATYLNRIERLVRLIGAEEDLQKVVLSRPIHLELNHKLDIYEIYYQLSRVYPDAFVYVFYHPASGLWIGATPERLIRINQRQAEIVSLAGTQVSGDQKLWRNKENHEQAIVTKYIQEILHKYHASDIRLSGPYTCNAGSVQHLKTELSAYIPDQNTIQSLIEDLHPTPAVCGYPQSAALEWIRQEEGYDRSYYTGYLGVFEGTDRMDLYVNLRCMQLFDKAVALYVGGGITRESQPQEEWDETEEKSKTLLSVLENFL